MSQRESGYERKERDLYETPGWVTEALRPNLPRPPTRIWEPACGSGKMVRVMEGWGAFVIPSDIEPASDLKQFEMDFLNQFHHMGEICEAIITNPPYDQASQFCEEALRRTEEYQGIVAMLLRCDFDHAKSRTHLFRDCPAFAKKLVLMRRIKWFESSKGSPSFNHAWYIWDWKHEGAPTLAYGPA